MKKIYENFNSIRLFTYRNNNLTFLIIIYKCLFEIVFKKKNQKVG